MLKTLSRCTIAGAIVVFLPLVLMTAAANASSARTGRAATASATTASARGTVRAVSTDAVVSFQIVNYKSGRCLGISGGEDDAPAVLWNCNGSANQSWHWDISVVYFGEYARLVNGDGECLGVAGGSVSEGADIYAWSCSTDLPYNQFWATQYTDVDGTLWLGNLGSNMVVGVAGGSTANGAQLVQWDGLAHPDQYWRLPIGA